MAANYQARQPFAFFQLGASMQISVENVGKLERKLTVKLPAEQLDSQVRTRLQEMGRNIRLKGFRPGKIPPKVIEQRFGAQVRGEAFNELVRNSFQSAVDDQKLRPAMAPSISTTGQSNNGEIEYVATFEVLPEIAKIDVSSLSVTKPTASVTDVDVDQMIDTLRQQRRSWTPVERTAQVGDMVLFEYSAQSGDVRHPAEGFDRVGTLIGSNAMFVEFENVLVGVKGGEEKKVELTFPADFRIIELAGKRAAVELKVSRVQEAQMPELDDVFVASFGVTQGGIERFREDVRANLERELKATLSARLKNEVVQKLVAAYADLELPQSMIAAEARALAQQAEAQARQAGQNINQPPEAFAAIAQQRVSAGVLIGEIARQNDLRLDSRRVAETLSAIASTYEEPERVVELYSNDPQLMSGLQSRVLEDQVADWVANHAQVSEQALSFSEVMRPNA